MTRSFGGILAVSSVTFDVRSNEIIGIMGPNGAGKTTLLTSSAVSFHRKVVP